MKRFLISVYSFFPVMAMAQLGVNFHQSNVPFVGINYQISNKVRTELRLGADNYFELISVEGVATYDILKKDEYEFYAGLGFRTNNFTGIVIPVGINIYPLTTKQFGFHIELAPIVGDGNILRGSWGIRYRFAKKDG
jgi:hypothetical protein